MKDLLEALTIFQFYMPHDWESPLGCEHDTLTVRCDVAPPFMNARDAERLTKLGFRWDGDSCWYSTRFGS